MVDMHDFVSISITPVDVNEAGETQLAPERQEDNTPEIVCQHCYMPFSDWLINATNCPGPSVPDDISSLGGEHGSD